MINHVWSAAERVAERGTRESMINHVWSAAERVAKIS